MTEDDFTWYEYCILLLAVFGLYSLIQHIGALIMFR